MPAIGHEGLLAITLTELAQQAVLDFAAQLGRHCLHAIADAEYRHAELEYRLWRARRFAFDHR
jgi:hypothetical protein